MIDGNPVRTCYWCIPEKTGKDSKVRKQYVMVRCIMKIYRELYFHSNQVNVSLQFINDTDSSNLTLYFIYVLLVKKTQICPNNHISRQSNMSFFLCTKSYFSLQKIKTKPHSPSILE